MKQDKRSCPACRKAQNLDVERCRNVSDGYICSRERDHKGPHMACGFVTHALAVWTNQNDITKNFKGLSDYKIRKLICTQ